MPPGEWLAGECARLLGRVWLAVAVGAGSVPRFQPTRRRNAGVRRDAGERREESEGDDFDDQGEPPPAAA